MRCFLTSLGMIGLLACLLVLPLHLSLAASDERKNSDSAAGDSSAVTQVHIAYGVNSDEMVVSWSTGDRADDSYVDYWLAANASQVVRVTGTRKRFVDGGAERRRQFLHRALLTRLQSGARYNYRCGSPSGGWSRNYSFAAKRVDAEWAPRLAVIGDFGLNNSEHTMPRLLSAAKSDAFDVLLHNGDIAYDMCEDGGRVGDRFMEMVEPVVANYPYMMSVGNHEEAYNFSHYKARFDMPDAGQNAEGMFYSVDIGPVHLVSYATEFYFYLDYGIEQIYRQYAWLIHDLREANRPERRRRTPWIVTMGHRPMYCSNNEFSNCVTGALLLRYGIPILAPLGLDRLWNEFGVDVAFTAHEHSYERSWPVFHDEVYNGSFEYPYVNPRATVHLLCGSAGNREYTDPFIENPIRASAFRSDDYGFGLLTAHNETHLQWDYYSDDQGGKIIDSIWIVQQHHGPFKQASDEIKDD